MKINPKVYKNLNGEPFEVQDIDGIKVAFYDMNETSYLTQYAGRGKFAIWTSAGGNDYKVLIEKSYYEALKPFYEFNVNRIWLGFLIKAEQVTNSVNKRFVYPSLIAYLLIATLSVFFLQQYTAQILIALIVLIFVSNIFQTRITTKRIREANVQAQDEIRESLGVEEFDRLVKSQEEHYKNYFKFEEPETVETQEVIENEKSVENEEEKDK